MAISLNHVISAVYSRWPAQLCTANAISERRVRRHTAAQTARPIPRQPMGIPGMPGGRGPSGFAGHVDVQAVQRVLEADALLVDDEVDLDDALDDAIEARGVGGEAA